ncbi:MAG: hypothetical protein AABY86_12785, partial [Bdellovibrionota bacterium]
MKSIVCLSLLAVFSFPAFALLLKDAVITGKVKSYDDKVVSIIDRYGKTHVIQKSKISKKIKLEKVKNLTVRVPLKPDQFAFSQLPYGLNNISKLKKPAIENLVLAYMYFIQGVDQQVHARGDYKILNKDDDKYSNWGRVLLDMAYAQESVPSNNYTCFWGGWPTSTNGSGVGASCEPPFRNQNQTRENSDDPMSYHSCGGGSNVYRCNPVLFGASTQTHTGTGLGAAAAATGASSVQVRPVPASEASHGMCVVSARDNIVERCLTASLPNLQAIVEGIKNDPAKAAAFERFANSVEEFCRQARNATNSVCGDLRER